MNNSYSSNFGLRVDYFEYTVKKGDSLFTIAKEFNTTVNDLIDLNLLTSNTIYPGQVIMIGKGNLTTDKDAIDDYITSYDETIESISKQLNVMPNEILKLNGCDKLKLANGQILKVPKRSFYEVKEDDTVDSILKKLNKNCVQIMKANASNWLKPGTKINY